MLLKGCCRNHPRNPFSCVASDLYLPRSWADDRPRCRDAKIPDEVVYRPKWLIAIAQEMAAIGNGVRFSWLTFDEEYGSVPQFWFELDRLGQRGIGEVRSKFLVWPSLPHCQSTQAVHAPKRVDNVCRFSPVFRNQGWYRLTVKDTTRGPAVWELRAGRVYLVDTRGHVSVPTDRAYWLLVIRNPRTGEHKYLISNAAGGANWKQMMAATFARWHVEKWFERAKQEAGFGAFEVRRYSGLLRHWFCAALAMYFLAEQTQRLRWRKSADHAGAGGGGNERDRSEGVEPLAALAC